MGGKPSGAFRKTRIGSVRPERGRKQRNDHHHGAQHTVGELSKQDLSLDRFIVRRGDGKQANVIQAWRA